MIVDCRVPELAATVAALTQGLDAFSGETIFVVEHGPSGKLRLLRNDVLRFETERPGDLLIGLECDIDEETPRLLAGRAAFHAAICARGTDAILVAGSSGAGKSTLAVALVARGFDYGSDDTALVEEDGAVRSYPRGIQLRPGTLQLIEGPGDRFLEMRYEIAKRPPLEVLVPVPEATARGPVRVAALAFLDRRSERYSARPISVAEATARLLSHALQNDDPVRDLRRARCVAEGASSRVVVEGGRPGEIAEALVDLVFPPANNRSTSSSPP